MAYRLDLAEPVPQELRRAAAEQIRSALADLRDGGDDRQSAVRQARKSIKKARAVLRLARDGMPARAFRAQNAALRDAARHLAPVRDADMLGPAIDALAERFAGRLPASAFATARAVVDGVTGAREGSPVDVGPQAVSADMTPDVATAMARGADDLEAVLDGIGRWRIDRCDLATLVDGCARVYADGRRAWRDAGDEPTGEALHEWRKRVKDLWYHLRLLRDVWPDLLQAQIDEVKRLSDLLGEEHDLAVLQDALAAMPHELGPLIAERRQELADAAHTTAARAYAERPRAFGRRLSRLARAAG